MLNIHELYSNRDYHAEVVRCITLHMTVAHVQLNNITHYVINDNRLRIDDTIFTINNSSLFTAS